MIEPSRSKLLLHRLTAFCALPGRLQVEGIPVLLHRLPPAFFGARIAVVSDVHLPDTMVSLRRLTEAVALQRPDAVFLTGDLTNSYAPFAGEPLRELAAAMTSLAPCFAIPGNHELRLEREPLYRDILEQSGVHYMHDSYADWEKDGAALRLFGMAQRRPAPLRLPAEQPAIVLAHKPQYMDYYVCARWNLVVAGHAHGGQVRVAGRGVYSPGQGLLPAYTGGVYRQGDTTMVVSRGLGNSSIPVRVHNAAHLPLLLLLPADD